MSPKMMEPSEESFGSEKDWVKLSGLKRGRRNRERCELLNSKQRQKQNVSPANGWFESSSLFESKESKIKGGVESSGLNKIRNRRNVNVNLQAYEVENLLGMVENMYEKAMNKKSSLKNIVTERQIKMEDKFEVI